jgi:hypothetical protein
VNAAIPWVVVGALALATLISGMVTARQLDHLRLQAAALATICKEAVEQ